MFIGILAIPIIVLTIAGFGFLVLSLKTSYKGKRAKHYGTICLTWAAVIWILYIYALGATYDASPTEKEQEQTPTTEQTI